MWQRLLGKQLKKNLPERLLRDGVSSAHILSLTSLMNFKAIESARSIIYEQASRIISVGSRAIQADLMNFILFEGSEVFTENYFDERTFILIKFSISVEVFLFSKIFSMLQTNQNLEVKTARRKISF